MISAFLLMTFSLVIAIICRVTPVYADQSQSFVWVADTRGDANSDVISWSVLIPIVNSILAQNPAPKVVIFGGDAAYRGGTTNLTDFKTGFTDRIEGAGIPVAFAIGNHEIYTRSGETPAPLDRQTEFQAMFNKPSDLSPIVMQNGPAGYDKLAFSFRIGNSLFIVADSFYATSNAIEPSYGVSQAQQDWIKGLLQNNNSAHTFMLTHVPSWTPGHLSVDSNMADFWQMITTSGSATNTNASILFAGHEHLYFRTLHDGTHEVLAGTGGAPIGCETGEECNLTIFYPGDILALRYNYATVSVNGRYVTVSVLDQANQFIDWFQFFDNSGVNNSTITNTAAIAPDSAEKQPTGILAGSSNTINNSAAISNVITGIDAVSNNIITNSGSITPLSGGNGIHVYDNNTITNTVAGNITGNSTDLWGIWVNTGNTVVNQGTVAVSGTNSVAFLAQGDNNILTNTGTLSASGTDSYAAKFLGTGNTLVNSGTISGNIWFDAGNNAFTNNGTLNGSGSLYKTGSGTLTLRGPASYTGGTYLNGGVINVTQDASLGALSGGLLFNGGTLQVSADMTSARNTTLNSGGGTFDTNGNALTLSGVISGPGSLTKAGTGTLTLSGVHTYTGQGTVSEGMLFLTSGASHSSTLTVNPGATVGGYGTLGNVNNNGVVSPGGSIGTLNIIGNYTQGPGGTLDIEIASTTSKDLLAINGTANLSGSLKVLWSGGYVPEPQNKFTILTASSGITGQFSSLLTNITPTVLFKPKYDIPNQAYLMVERDYTNQTLLPYLTVNQRAVGSMLNSVGNTATGDLDTVLTVIDALPAYGQTAYALDQLAPKGSDAQSGMGISSASFQTGNLSERLSDLRYGIRGTSLKGLYFKNGNGAPVMLADINPDLTGMLPSGVDERWGFFVKGNAVYGDQKDTPDMTGYNFTSVGITMGSDYHFSKSFIAGLMLGLNNSRANVDNMGSKVKMDSYTLGTYGTYYKKNFYMDGSISYGFANYDNTRRIVFPGLDRTAASSPNGNQFTAYTGTGYDLRKSNWIITPNVSLQYTKLNTDSYTESGAGAINLNVDRQNTESLLGNAGARVSYTWQTDKAVIMPGIRASYGYEFSRDSQNVTSRLAQGSSPFSIQTMSPDRNFLSLGAGITAFTVRDMSVYINYDVQIGENKYVAQSVNAGLRMGF
ncbi:MAG: autotransporter domain-containing protein [Proteobacteria bacterium]|nr:autotransporter domain-containing protein [Pseudomonadota bacterium]